MDPWFVWGGGGGGQSHDMRIYMGDSRENANLAVRSYPEAPF